MLIAMFANLLPFQKQVISDWLLSGDAKLISDNLINEAQRFRTVSVMLQDISDHTCIKYRCFLYWVEAMAHVCSVGEVYKDGSRKKPCRTGSASVLI